LKNLVLFDGFFITVLIFFFNFEIYSIDRFPEFPSTNFTGYFLILDVSSKFCENFVTFLVGYHSVEQGAQTQKDVKNQFIWKNKQNNSLFPLKSLFCLMFAGRMWPADRVLETPAVEAKKTHIWIGWIKLRAI